MEEVALSSSFDDASEESIIRRYDRLIGYLARRFRLDVDDLVQVGRIELLQAFRLWQTKPHNATFWTYARKAVLGAMINHATREVSRIAKETESGLAPAPVCAPDDALEALEHISSLSPREASVLQMYVAGYDAEEIAEANGIRRSRVYQLLEDSMETINERA
jgi:RNA polymerase sigma factor (sigma-70 family)